MNLRNLNFKGARRVPSVIVLVVGGASVLILSACNLPQTGFSQAPTVAIPTQVRTATITPTPSETIPPYTPIASLTPSQTLRPPPTFEPPTATFAPSLTPSITVTSTLDLSVSIPGLIGAESPTPISTAGCTPKKEWKLRYTVQRNDALSSIADRYNTNVQDLMAANCLTNPNLIVIGQELRVPGSVQPVKAVVCDPWEVLTPINGTQAIAGTGSITMNWRGPRADHNLIRFYKPDGSTYERVVDLRQNDTFDLSEINAGGTYTWYVYPLNSNYQQIGCKEGGPWTFMKAEGPAPTAVKK